VLTQVFNNNVECLNETEGVFKTMTSIGTQFEYTKNKLITPIDISMHIPIDIVQVEVFVEVQIDFAHVGLFVAIQTESKITRVDLEL
jgi:hypothetical protein